jgi:hypothetical protein
VITRALYGLSDNPRCLKKPTKILYPTDYWPVKHQESQTVFDNYIAKLEAYIGVKKTPINLENLWQETNSVQTDESLEDYFEHVFEWVANPDQWTGFFKAFNQEYEETFGHQPVLNPQLRFKRSVNEVQRRITSINHELTIESEIGYQARQFHVNKRAV